MKMRRALSLVAIVATFLGAVPACSSGSGSTRGGQLATCVTSYSGGSDSCTVGAICSGTIYRANCDAQPDGGACVCDVIDAGPSKTVPFQAAVCAPLASTDDPTPNASAANAACGWNL